MHQCKMYLAGRYGRRKELVEYAEKLKSIGHIVTSEWLDGTHEAKDTSPTTVEAGMWATQDIMDIDFADTFVAFTEEPCAESSRGGRHVEFGYALSRNKHIIVIGPLENIFYSNICGHHFDSFHQWFDTIT